MSKSDLSLIETTVRKNIDQFFEKKLPHFIVGVSGGIDSMCLLYAFKRLGVPAFVSHINYQKRGLSSDKDQELVEQMAFEWGFECHTVRADPQEADGHNFQQWARNFRYDVFKQMAKVQHADAIAVAHHEDDQVETILQKIFRGAGLASWTGMDIWDATIFRPFLHISRRQIEAYAEEHAIPYRTDESNLESDFARNFLRNDWLEKVSDFFPGWKQNILRVNQQAGNYEEAIDWIAERISAIEGIDREAMHSLKPGVQKAVILYLLKQQDPDLQISQDSLNQLDTLSKLQTGKEIQLNEEFSILRDRNHYVIRSNHTEVFSSQKLDYSQLEASGFEHETLVMAIAPFHEPDYSNMLYLDPQKITWPVTLRRWQHGDRFQPFGMEGHQLVSDHLTNRKISAAHKDETLVIESFDKSICAIIFPPIKNQTQPGTISEQVKCDNQTKYCLKIKHRT
ncbi:MAG TPA: tRNA lysidine(34) synthetase TilS [Balneolaceae bacterium]|nr:tRNA lysidine(34) synthetase TilS [Balneolaceae bacterium]